MTTDPLDEYNARRDFERTAEPRGARGRAAGNRFIVQKHDASRLHWDFRLELGGVLKSWAVTRGPSLNPRDKRLAVRTEDHPLSYATFEGTIPKRQYGGGTVMLWDRGTWQMIEGKDAEANLEEGHLHFVLGGERMRGEWLLVRMKPKPGEKRENWLLRKIADDEAGGSDELVARELTSVASGRTMAAIAAGRKAKRMTKTRKKTTVGGKPPKFRKPQLATLVDDVPGGPNWLHEIKYDGYRCLLAVAADRARIYTRSGLDWTDRFPAVAAAAAALDLPPALIDGEVVQLDSAGNPNFSALQDAITHGAPDVRFFAFDLLDLDGTDLTKRTTVERKQQLEALLTTDDATIRVADHVVGAGQELLDALCGAGQEGIISKRADAPYRGRRTRNWLKIKCTRREEFVIIGWRESSKRGRPFSSLLLAQREGDELVYRGRVGTGFSESTLEVLAGKLARLSRKTAPADVPRSAARDAHWVTPTLVAEIGHAELTADGIVRHASFLGLRGDKAADEVHHEAAAAAPKGGGTVEISHPDRVIFPDADVTKGDLAEYYRAIGAVMLPFVATRPVSLVRCPEGRAKQCFFQKHVGQGFGDHVSHVSIREKNGSKADYLRVDDIDGVLACVQMGTIEFHGWLSRADDVEHPDRMVFDLDPGEGITFGDIRKAARQIAQQLGELGLTSFAMVSGGKGIHVVVPITPGPDWPVVKDFAKRFALAMAAAEPKRYTATMSKARRTGKIFIDWLRNQRGSTSVVPYSARARVGAPVAAPVAWEELDQYENATPFTVQDARQLLTRNRSAALKGWGTARQELPDA